MRLILMFDMPVETSSDRKAYRVFRKFLINEGFIMHQFSVYSKLVLNGTANLAMIKRINNNNPSKGKISILTVTEKQFSKMIYLCGDCNSSISNTEERIVYLGEKYEN